MKGAMARSCHGDGRERNANYRQTFTQTQIFLKSFQWHCCSIRQSLPLVSWALAVWGAEIATSARNPQQTNILESIE
jgi:hypothetical protein